MGHQAANDTNSPLWISHRGYKVQAVENTYQAFKAAVDIGFTGLETDLRITRDNHLVLIHDPSLVRLVNDERPVIALSRRELERIQFREGGKPLFFDQFAEEFGCCTWTLDIKPENGIMTITALRNWTERHRSAQWLTKQAKFLTWRASHEQLLTTLLPGAKCYARKYECWRAALAVMAGLPIPGSIKPDRTYALVSHLGGIPLFRRPVVEYFHKRGARTVAFLPETEQDTNSAIDAGFDEILTDGPIIHEKTSKFV